VSAAFYERLGFRWFFELPAEGEPGYIGLRRGGYELAVVAARWPARQYGRPAGGGGLRFEMFVYVDAVDAVVGDLRGAGVPVLGEPADMPWGERLAYVEDPDGNPVAVAKPRLRRLIPLRRLPGSRALAAQAESGSVGGVVIARAGQLHPHCQIAGAASRP